MSDTEYNFEILTMKTMTGGNTRLIPYVLKLQQIFLELKETYVSLGELEYLLIVQSMAKTLLVSYGGDTEVPYDLLKKMVEIELTHRD